MKKKKSKIHQDNVGIYTISRRQGRGDCPERPGYLQHALLIPQMGSGFPRKVCLNVQDWGQVCRLEAQKWVLVNCGGKPQQVSGGKEERLKSSQFLPHRGL